LQKISISDTATRPSDVISIYGGKTVEVLNPDAEGRLILADALVRAQETKDLDAIVDVATLTGAQVVALGTRTSAVMTNNAEFSSHFLDVTKETEKRSGQCHFLLSCVPHSIRPLQIWPMSANEWETCSLLALLLKDFVADELPVAPSRYCRPCLQREQAPRLYSQSEEPESLFALWCS
jgi:leucyl aminopeptidase